MHVKFRPKTPFRLRDKIYRSYGKPRVSNSNGQNSSLKAEFVEILGVLAIECQNHCRALRGFQNDVSWVKNRFKIRKVRILDERQRETFQKQICR